MTGASEREEKLVTLLWDAPPCRRSRAGGAADRALGLGRGSGAGGAHPRPFDDDAAAAALLAAIGSGPPGLRGAIVQATSGAHRVAPRRCWRRSGRRPKRTQVRREGFGAGRRPDARPAGGGQADAGAPTGRRGGLARSARGRPPFELRARAVVALGPCRRGEPGGAGVAEDGRRRFRPALPGHARARGREECRPGHRPRPALRARWMIRIRACGRRRPRPGEAGGRRRGRRAHHRRQAGAVALRATRRDEALGRLCVAGGTDLDDPRHRARRRRRSPGGAHRPRAVPRSARPDHLPSHAEAAR